MVSTRNGIPPERPASAWGSSRAAVLCFLEHLESDVLLSWELLAIALHADGRTLKCRHISPQRLQNFVRVEFPDAMRALGVVFGDDGAMWPLPLAERLATCAMIRCGG